jgi:NAD(P)-dependent dehydrogenase (short-subunit alcohol dehydrogenase family)
MAIVLVTGSSTGIGFATAKTLSKNGHVVYATMRNPQHSPELQQFADKEKLALHVLAMDVDRDESVKTAIATILEKEGHIDVLVNNAGIAAHTSLEETPLPLFKSVMETNYFGAIRCIQAILPSMRERRTGTIINVTSVAGKIFGQAHSAYCGSKAALEAISESLAQEVAPFNIRVAVVEPGVIATPIFTKGNEIPGDSHYPNTRRLLAFFAASLEKAARPEVVAGVIDDIVAGRSRKFRNPAGPDASPLLQWRASTPDEEWINAHNIDDETWIRNQEEFLGLKVRPYMENRLLAEAK